jgi:hypothetical protein
MGLNPLNFIFHVFSRGWIASVSFGMDAGTYSRCMQKNIEMIERHERVQSEEVRTNHHPNKFRDQISSMKVRPLPRAQSLFRFTESRGGCVGTHSEKYRRDCLIL